MDTPRAKASARCSVPALVSVAVLALAACSPQAAAPTAAPAKPAPTVAPAKPAPTTAPPKAEAPTAKPAAPAAKPTEKPAARAAEFDEKAVADFYKGKAVRIVVGFGPGGATDTYARMLQRVLPKYIPGNPTVVVENKPGGGSMLAANTVYASEPRDGTVIVTVDQGIVLQQTIGAPGVQYDAAKFNWVGSSNDTFAACAVRTNAGITTIQDIMGSGKELAVASFGRGVSYDPPAVMNAALGTKFKIVTGYESGAAQRLAVQNNEVPGFCTTFEDMSGIARELFEGAAPAARVLIVTGAETANHPFLKGVPAAETLAKTDEARALLRAIHLPIRIQLPHALAPDVPKDRVAALRRAYDRAYADPELLGLAEKAQLPVRPKSGEEVTRIVQEVLGTPPGVVDKLKDALK